MENRISIQSDIQIDFDLYKLFLQTNKIPIQIQMSTSTITDLKNHINHERFLVLKGKQAANLLTLLDDFELHPELKDGEYTSELLALHLDAHILNSDYVGMKLLLQRKQV